LLLASLLRTSECFQMDGGLPQFSEERVYAWEGDSGVLLTTPEDMAGFSLAYPSFSRSAA